ncbi:MAG: TonB-dependent receptor, partial [Bacteroidales bacterium]|nr:TonB-dependent receptor [Bacteroidales bacterium]
NVSYYAGYISAELNPWNWVKAIVGVRAEKYRQRYTGRDITGEHQLNNTLVINDLDFFPTVNLIFPIAEKQNIRGSYSITIARPSFKEMSYAEIFDAISGRTFIGGLFRDANDLAGVEYWDGNLVTTSIQNFDLRYELFLNEGQMVSLSGFYKSFEKPIELVQYFSQKDTYQPRNVGDGKVLGVEFELRKNLGFAGESAKNFIFTTNVTVTKSEIELSKTEYDSRVLNARQGEVVGKYRDMAGQAPYIVNAGIAYNGSSTGFWGGLEAGVYYNVQGTTLQIAGIDDIPDVYNKPFHSLNLNANKSFGRDKRFQIGFKIDNILNSKSESIFRSFEATDQYYSRISSGVTFHARFAWTLFK